MKKKTTTALIFAATFLTGCATATHNYTPPVENKIGNSKKVNKQFDLVWDQLVKELSSDFFVINNIDKNSRLINISFSSQKPSDFVDCGATARSFSNIRGTQQYNYKVADSSFYKDMTDSIHVFNYQRTTKLEGRSNIYVAPDGAGTQINVNTKYVLSINVMASTLDGRPAGVSPNTIDFTTKQPGTYGEITCNSSGVIEKRILGLVGD